MPLAIDNDLSYCSGRIEHSTKNNISVNNNAHDCFKNRCLFSSHHCLFTSRANWSISSWVALLLDTFCLYLIKRIMSSRSSQLILAGSLMITSLAVLSITMCQNLDVHAFRVIYVSTVDLSCSPNVYMSSNVRLCKNHP